MNGAAASKPYDELQCHALARIAGATESIEVKYGSKP